MRLSAKEKRNEVHNCGARMTDLYALKIHEI